MMFSMSYGFSQSESASISGKSLDTEGNPLPLAIVKLQHTADSTLYKGAITDEQGAYELKNLKAGSYFIQITSLGLADFTVPPFELKPGEAKTIEAAILEVESQQLQEVIVESKRPLLVQKPDMTVLNVAGSTIAEGKDAIEMLKFAPGVVVDGQDQISLNNKSGVVVMIDGQRTRMSGQDLAMILKSIPANTIDNIELITNPSAKYDAEGSAGIININLRRDRSLGTNGSVQASVQQAEVNTTVSTSLNLNHRTENMNLYGAMSYHKGGWNEKTQLTRVVTDDSGTQKIFDQQDTRQITWDSPSFRAGADFFLGEKHTVGVLASGFWSDGEGGNSGQSQILNAEGTIDSTLFSNNNAPSMRGWVSFNANYNYQDTLGNELNFDADYYVFNLDGESELRNEIIEPGGRILSTIGNQYETDSRIEIYSSKVDYSKQLNEKSSLETGAKYSRVDSDNDFKSYILTNEIYVIDPGQTNRFRYEENILAAYMNYRTQFGKLTAQVGLRAENSDIKGLSTDIFDNKIEVPDTSYFNLFPSAFLNYEAHYNHQFRLSYSRRISRPNYQDINPFEFFLDQYTAERGNPYLRPQFTNSFELSYIFMRAASLSLSYSVTDDVFERITRQEGEQVFITTENVGTNKNFNINISMPIPIAEWWSMYTWLGPFYAQYEGVLEEGPYSVDQWGFNGYLNSTFSFDDWSLELSGNYNSPSRRVLFNDRSSGAFNVAVGKRVMKGNGYVKLAVNDIFETQRWKSSVNFANMDFDVLRTWESRQVRLSFSYNFGNEEVKASRKRSVASENEQRRIKE
jgi:outer membrane receptor protein involved in Fe transport